MQSDARQIKAAQKSKALSGLLDADPELLVELLSVKEAAEGFRTRSLAESTRRYQDADWDRYAAWCSRFGIAALPVNPEVVALYIADLARTIKPDGTPAHKAASLRRYVSSISRKSYESGGGRGLGKHEAIAEVIAGISRLRQEGRQPKTPLLRNDIVALIEAMEHRRWPDGVTAARDRLAILWGFATAMRRSEVAAVDIGDVRLVQDQGLIVRVAKSKTDQEAHGSNRAIPYGSNPITCIPCHWARWVALLAAPTRPERMRLVFATGAPATWTHVCRGRVPTLEPGEPLFRPVNKAGEILSRRLSDASLNALLGRRLEDAGYNPDPYGYHSLRAGMVTEARKNGASHREVRNQTQHGSDAMVDIYDREANPFIDNGVMKLGL